MIFGASEKFLRTVKSGYPKDQKFRPKNLTKYNKLTLLGTEIWDRLDRISP